MYIATHISKWNLYDNLLKITNIYLYNIKAINIIVISSYIFDDNKQIII